MAYNRNNYLKQVRYIISVYHDVKKEHLPDTYIVRVEFPKKEIYISYRKWMMIKGMKKSDTTAQMTMF